MSTCVQISESLRPAIRRTEARRAKPLPTSSARMEGSWTLMGALACDDGCGRQEDDGCSDDPHISCSHRSNESAAISRSNRTGRAEQTRRTPSGAGKIETRGRVVLRIFPDAGAHVRAGERGTATTSARRNSPFERANANAIISEYREESGGH